MKLSSADYESVEPTKITSGVSCRRADQKAGDIWCHVCNSLIGGVVGSGGGHMGSVGQRLCDLLVTP